MEMDRKRVTVSLDAETARGLRRAAAAAGVGSIGRAAAIILSRAVCGGREANRRTDEVGGVEREVSGLFAGLVPASAECVTGEGGG